MLENSPALFLLILLIPVIILYILKPKPRTIKIPSLLLLLQDKGQRKLRKLFETLIRDPLLFIQLIIITTLVVSLANPYFTGSTEYDHTILVLDASASMGAIDISPDRFTKAVDMAKGYISSSKKITLVLAGKEPVLLFHKVDGKKANKEIQNLKPGATGTNLIESMLLAINLIENEEEKLVVISDFSGQDITMVRKIIESKKIPVEYRQVGTGGSNTGIIEAAIDGNDLKFNVKNYNNIPEEVKVRIINENGVRIIDRTINKNSMDLFVIPDIKTGTTRISLEPEDDLHIDNTLYISMPEKISKKVLLLRDSPGKYSPVKVVLDSIPDIEVEEVPFERAPRKIEHGLVVLFDYTGNSLLPGTADDLKKYVENGGTLVVIAENDLELLNIEELLPIDVEGIAGYSGFKVKNSQLTNDIDFGISRYLKSVLKEGAVELVSAGEGTVLAYRNIGAGKVIYLGINDRWGDFHLKTSYPVFWFKLLEFAHPSPQYLNFKTGNTLLSGSGELNDVYIDETGFFEIDDRTIALNLLDEKESNISINRIEQKTAGKSEGIRTEKIYLDNVLSILAIILIALELYYLKYRGDI